MTLDDVKKQLLAWEMADMAVAKSQSYSIDGLSLTRVDAELITKKIDYWQRKVNQHTAIANGENPMFKTASFNGRYY